MTTTQTTSTPSKAATGTVVTPDLTVRKSKKRKRMHKVERGMAKALRRYADALKEGADRYDELSGKSAAKKKDGAVKDYGKNLYKAAKLAMKRGKKAPKGLHKAWTSPLGLKPKHRKRMGKGVAAMANLFGF